MRRKVWENALYVFKEDILRFWKFGLLVYLVVLGVLGIQKIDAYVESIELPSSNAAVAVAENPSAQKLDNYIEISKIGVQAPIAFVPTKNPKDYKEPLSRGVTHYPSVQPGERGAAIILGHSAPPGWLGGEYDGVFREINSLENGDEISVVADGNVYTYYVNGKSFLQSGQDLPTEALATDKTRLLLLSCWPPGIDNKRIMIQADAI